MLHEGSFSFYFANLPPKVSPVWSESCIMHVFQDAFCLSANSSILGLVFSAYNEQKEETSYKGSFRIYQQHLSIFLPESWQLSLCHKCWHFYVTSIPSPGTLFNWNSKNQINPHLCPCVPCWWVFIELSLLISISAAWTRQRQRSPVVAWA